MSQKILFVINPGSGKNNTDWKKEITTYFDNKDDILDFYELEKPPECEKLKKYLSLSDAHKIVAVGGDGTVTLIAGLLSGSSKSLGILPAGSANGMAKELMIPDNPQKAIEIIEKGIVTPIDSILINNKHFSIHLSDIGVNAQLIKNFEDSDNRGMIGYAKVLLKTLITKDRFTINLTTSDKKITRKAIMVVIANAGKYGTGAMINPHSNISDKIFEAVIVKKITAGSVIRMIASRKFKPKNIETYHCRALEVESRKKVHFQVDGEYLGKINKITAVIQPHSVNLILPAAYHEDK